MNLTNIILLVPTNKKLLNKLNILGRLEISIRAAYTKLHYSLYQLSVNKSSVKIGPASCFRDKPEQTD